MVHLEGRRPWQEAVDVSPYVDYNSAYNSLLLGVTSKEAYSRFPMPFASGATLTIQNRSGTRIGNLRLRLDVERLAQLPTDWGRFHATWTESPAATDKSPVTGPKNVPVKVVLQKEGRGKYVGVMLTVDWPYEADSGGERATGKSGRTKAVGHRVTMAQGARSISTAGGASSTARLSRGS